MKSLYSIAFFSVLLWVQTCGLSSAQSPTVQATHEENLPVPVFGMSSPTGTVSDMQVIPDRFGDNLYFYKDSEGNRCVTNSMPMIEENISLADSGDSLKKSGSDSALIPPDTPVRFSDLDVTDEFDDPDILEEEEPMISIADPLEPINRFFFQFNEKLYFWFLKPVSKGYRDLVPEPARASVRRFFYNLGFPVRFVNCLFQAKIDEATYEFRSFLVNSTIGLGGLFDPAKHPDIGNYDEDLGQTLGSYGLGPAFYINWPVFGPSSLRDTFGMAGDSFLDPLNYMVPRTKYNVAVKGYETVNKTSFFIGDYEDLKRSALDPYIAVRDAYYQNRKSEIKK